MSAEDLADRLWHQMGASYPEFVVATREALAQAWDEGAHAAVELHNTGTRMTLRARIPFPADENPYEGGTAVTHNADIESPGLTKRCSYVTAANMRCLLAANEDHSTGHDVLGDLHDDPEWGKKRAWVWAEIERSRLTGLLYEWCACGHIRGAHTRGPAKPGGPCCSRGCACRTFRIHPAEEES